MRSATTETVGIVRLGSAAGAVLLAFFARIAVSSTIPEQRTMTTIAGPARAIDGDTIEVDRIRIRLEGIDAPESVQTCRTSQGEDWSCGQHATAYLHGLIEGQDVACDQTGIDKYRRALATCYVGERNLNEEMVRAGLAWAFVKYSTEYVAVEAAARLNRIGVWEGTATAPWDFRHGVSQVAENTVSRGCAIKGNISSHGHIYHMPWSRWYDRVTITSARGEQWFCSETQALAAGWRRASTN